MWIWPRRAKGFHVSLRPGLYVLPSHLTWSDVQGLTRLLIEGMEGVEHGLELDWSSASKLVTGPHSSEATLAWIRVAEGVEPTEVETTLATLAMRWCFVQYEAAGIWPETAWYERQVKDPLVSFLRREFHREDHPLREIGIRELPLEEIAALTVDPVELLLILEDALTHRARSLQYGCGRDDWMRSIRRAAADRLAARLRSMPGELLQRAVDLLLAHPDGLFSMLEDHEAAVALADTGLVRHEGNDALVYPLARRLHADGYIGRLVEKLPEDAWSDTGKRHVRDGLPQNLPILRPIMITPDLDFGTTPVVTPVACLEQVRLGVEAECDEAIATQVGAGFELLAERCAMLEGGQDHEALTAKISAWRHAHDEARADDGRALHWQQVIEACHQIVTDASDHDEVLELGFGLGFVGRFEVLDDLLEGEPESARRLLSLVRWVAVHAWLDHAPDADTLDLLARVADDALGHAADDTELDVALRVMLGDLASLRRNYRESVAFYERAMDGAPEAAHAPIAARCIASKLRLDDFSKLEELRAQILPLAKFPESQPLIARTLGLLATEFSFTAGFHSVFESTRETGPAPLPGGIGEITRIAWDSMVGEWPAAIHLARRLFEDLPQIGTHGVVFVRFAWAWMKSITGDLDVAYATFEELEREATTRGDRLLEAMVRRGLALVGQLLGDHERHIGSLSRALELELELDMGDARIVAVDLNLARALAGESLDPEFGHAFEATRAPTHMFSVSLTSVVVSRLLCLEAHFVSSMSSHESQPELLLGYARLRSRNFPTLRSALRQLIDAILTKRGTEDIDELISAVRTIAEGDDELLMWLDAQRSRIEAMRVDTE